jgi:Excreted virulence factor EspC, type VII ESX diderm
MGQDNLYTDIDGLRSFAQTHDDVSIGMSGLTASAYDAAGVAATHGPIASDVHNSLRGAIDARQGAQRSVSDIGERLAESLRQAAYSYEGVDHGSAERLRTAADAVEGATAPGGAGGTSGSAAANGGGNLKDVSATMTGAMKDTVGAIGGVLGPMTSGIGSAAGSLGSGLSSAASALTNSLSQAVSQAAKAAPSTASAVPAAASTGGIGQTGQQAGQTSQSTHTDKAEDVSATNDETRPGDSAGAGKAPTEPAAVQHNTPQSQPR